MTAPTPSLTASTSMASLYTVATASFNPLKDSACPTPLRPARSTKREPTFYSEEHAFDLPPPIQLEASRRSSTDSACASSAESGLRQPGLSKLSLTLPLSSQMSRGPVSPDSPTIRTPNTPEFRVRSSSTSTRTSRRKPVPSDMDLEGSMLHVDLVALLEDARKREQRYPRPSVSSMSALSMNSLGPVGAGTPSMSGTWSSSDGVGGDSISNSTRHVLSIDPPIPERYHASSDVGYSLAQSPGRRASDAVVSFPSADPQDENQTYISYSGRDSIVPVSPGAAFTIPLPSTAVVHSSASSQHSSHHSRHHSRTRSFASQTRARGNAPTANQQSHSTYPPPQMHSTYPPTSAVSDYSVPTTSPTAVSSSPSSGSAPFTNSTVNRPPGYQYEYQYTYALPPTAPTPLPLQRDESPIEQPVYIHKRGGGRFEWIKMLWYFGFIFPPCWIAGMFLLRRIEDLDYDFEAKTAEEEEEMKAYCESEIFYSRRCTMAIGVLSIVIAVAACTLATVLMATRKNYNAA